MLPDSSRANKSFILFADLLYDKDAVDPTLTPFDGEASTCDSIDGCVSRYNIQRGAYISELTVGGNPVDTLDIFFKRPDPDAIIYAGGNLNDNIAEIHLTSADGSGSTTIRVQPNGLIQIK